MPFLDFPSRPGSRDAIAAPSWCRGHPLFHNFLSCPIEAIMNACSSTSTPNTPGASLEEMDQDDLSATPTLRSPTHFSPEEEQRLLSAAHLQKQSGNTLFATAHYLAAIDAYTLALASTPIYLSHEVSILHSNLAACHLQLSAPTLAIEHATEAISRRPGWTKPVFRRCKAREMLGTWKELEIAVGEYEQLLLREDLADDEKRVTRRGLERCSCLLEDVRKKDVADAMKGLRGLGDGLLRPFGISTSDFGMKPDGKGGYSLEFKKSG